MSTRKAREVALALQALALIPLAFTVAFVLMEAWRPGCIAALSTAVLLSASHAFIGWSEMLR